jgi:hypothetical protein
MALRYRQGARGIAARLGWMRSVLGAAREGAVRRALTAVATASERTRSASQLLHVRRAGVTGAAGALIVAGGALVFRRMLQGAGGAGGRGCVAPRCKLASLIFRQLTWYIIFCRINTTFYRVSSGQVLVVTCRLLRGQAWGTRRMPPTRPRQQRCGRGVGK